MVLLIVCLFKNYSFFIIVCGHFKWPFSNISIASGFPVNFGIFTAAATVFGFTPGGELLYIGGSLLYVGLKQFKFEWNPAVVWTKQVILGRTQHFFEQTKCTLQNARIKFPHSELFWSAFSRIRTKYREMRSICPYSVRMLENADLNYSEYGHFLRNGTWLFIRWHLRIWTKTSSVTKPLIC